MAIWLFVQQLTGYQQRKLQNYMLLVLHEGNPPVVTKFYLQWAINVWFHFITSSSIKSIANLMQAVILSKQNVYYILCH